MSHPRKAEMLPVIAKHVACLFLDMMDKVQTMLILNATYYTVCNYTQSTPCVLHYGLSGKGQ